MPNSVYWGSLFGLALAGGAARVVHGGPLLRRRVLRLGRLELAVTVGAVLALGFHCAAMFFPTVVSSVPGSTGAARAVQDLGVVSQIAYWVPAALLLIALRRAWPPLLVVESGALLAVGVTMFSNLGLPVHFVAIACSVAATVALVTTLGGNPAGRTAGAEVPLEPQTMSHDPLRVGTQQVPPPVVAPGLNHADALHAVSTPSASGKAKYGRTSGRELPPVQ